MHICQCALSLCCCADRCSCSQINSVPCISVSSLHAKNSQPRLRQRLPEQAQTYWITPAHTQHLTAIQTCKQHFWVHAYTSHPDTRAHGHHVPHASHELYFGHSHISRFTPKAHMYLSSCPLLQHPGPQGDNRLLGCQAAEPSGMGRMTTYVPLGDQPGAER